MKLFIDSIFFIALTFLFVTEHSVFGHSIHNSKDVPVDVLLVDLERHINKLSIKINTVLEQRKPSIICDNYEQDIHPEVSDMTDEVELLREEFEENALQFFNDNSEAYFTLFEVRLNNINIRLFDLMLESCEKREPFYPPNINYKKELRYK